MTSWEPSSPHMRLAANAGLVDESLFRAICDADSTLASTTIFVPLYPHTIWLIAAMFEINNNSNHNKNIRMRLIIRLNPVTMIIIIIIVIH